MDIYSLGVVLWEIVTHEMPQRGTIRDVLVPSECPQEVADLIAACMQRDAKARPSAREVCRCAACSDASLPPSFRCSLDKHMQALHGGPQACRDSEYSSANVTGCSASESLSAHNHNLSRHVHARIQTAVQR